MPKLADLGLTNEQVGQADLDYASMPDQMGGFQEPPQPGTYRFKLPTKLDDIWESFDHDKGNPPGKRLRARFDDSHPLTIIQSPGGEKNGEPFMTSFTNAERRRGKKDDTAAPYISDLDYFNRDVFDVAQKPKTNAAYAQEFMKHGGQEFTADVEWSWRCNKDRNIYVDNGQGGQQEVQQLGCGAAYYQKDIEKQPSDPNDPNSPKVYPLRITCGGENCGASLRAFANLTRFRK